MSWDRKLWAVELHSPRSKPQLLGLLWCGLSERTYYDGEPNRLWLWTTRKPATEWARKERAKYAGRSDVCASWRFVVVRVRETVRRVKS